MRASATASTRSLLFAIAAAIGGVATVTPAAAQPGQRSEDESAGLVEAGRRALRARDWAAAAKALDQAIALNPRRIDAYVLRAAVHGAQRQYADGVRLLRRARELAPDNLDVLAGLGAQLVLGGDVDDGVEVLERVVAAEPRRYEAQSLLGRHYRRRGAWAQAIDAFEAYLASRPDELAGEDVTHRIELAEAYLRSGRAAAARDLYTAALAVRADEPAARLGLAWSLAAIDCRDARPVLARLGDLIERYPAIRLVQGQCELAIGDAARALALGEAYLIAAEVGGVTPAPAGFALVGEAAAELGDLARAKAAFARAQEVEPSRRRWSLKLAVVLRRSGDADAALAELDRLGAPAAPADDPAWWRELGEALIAAGRAGDAATRLTPALDALPGDAGLRAVAGEAALRAGDLDAALAHLDAAGDGARARAWRARALAADAARRLDAGDLGAAEAALARADQLAGGADPAIARNLGVVRLALDRPADAIAPLERSAQAEAAAATLLALGQARARAGQPEPAREAYARAAREARGDAIAVLVAIDRAALELDAGQAAAAVEALDAAAAEARQAGGELEAAHRDATRTASHAAGLAALRGGAASRAVALLEAADRIAGGKDVAIRCDLALAAVATGDRDAALRRLRAVAKVTCPFPAPADTQAVPILTAFVEGLDAKKAASSLKALAKLEAKASGATRRLLATATRVVALGAADRAYRGGELKEARRLLEQARRAETRAGADELAHNLAALDVADGKLAAAAAALEKLAPKLPEALVHLGVIADLEGDGERALERWRAARRAGVRFGLLDEWIAAKERIYGGGS